MHLSRVLVLSQTTNPGLRDRFDGWERAAEGSAQQSTSRIKSDTLPGGEKICCGRIAEKTI